MKRVTSLAFALAAVGAVSSTSVLAQGHPWTNLGGGKSGTFGPPILTASPLEPGKSSVIRLNSARRNAPVYLIFGFRRDDRSIFGGTLIPALQLWVSRPTDNLGNLAISVPFPKDPRWVGAEIYVQAIVSDPLATVGAAFSNGLFNAMCPAAKNNTEDFSTSTFFDAEASAATWGGGQLKFSLVGGDGRHGEFDARHGRMIPNTNPQLYEWDTDSFVIPATHTRSGRNETVTDGRFYFSKFVLPADTAVRFVGSYPVRLWVQGTARVDGIIQANGADIAADAAAIQRDNRPQPGEPGGTPGAFGGTGGDGGDRGDANGVVNRAYWGKDGATVQMVRGHAYATSAAGTGGHGSPQHPQTNKGGDIGFAFFNVIALEMNRGGGGGGFITPGGIGVATWDPAQDPNNGTRWLAPGQSPGGVRVPFPATFPNYTNGLTRQDHFMVGGSGGGGGGSGCGGAIKTLTSTPYFRIGRAGTGGGGAIGFRIGNELVVGNQGSIECRGGDAPRDEASFSIRGMMTPGGAGSGGSLFLQVSGRTQNMGTISVLGGTGGVTKGNFSDTLFRGSESQGGEGSPGMIHFEVGQNPSGYAVGVCKPAPRAISGLDARDRDVTVGVRSLWYPANLTADPEFLRYEIEAVVNGQPVKFSDDPLYGQLASGPISPIEFRVKGAELVRAPSGRYEVKASSFETPWLKYVGPFSTTEPTLRGSARPGGYRFYLTVNRRLGQTVEIKSVKVFWCK